MGKYLFVFIVTTFTLSSTGKLSASYFPYGEKEITELKKYGSDIYAASKKEIFKLTKTRWEKIYTELGSGEIIKLMPTKKGLFFVTDRGLYLLEKTGGKRLYDTRNIKDATVSDGIISLTTEKEIIAISMDDNGILSKKGLTTKNNVSLIDKNKILIGSEEGIQYIKLKDKKVKELPAKYLPVYALIKEPSIKRLQEIAIKYANLSDSKTKEWYKKSRLSALMPKISFNLEQSIEDNIDIDRGSTTRDDFYIIGPREQGTNWEISAEWELSKLLWNSDATTIDYREKYISENREELLNRLITLYFERKEEIINFITMVLSEDNNEDKGILRSMIRIEKLTSQIDALTNGYLSKNSNYTIIMRLLH